MATNSSGEHMNDQTENTSHLKTGGRVALVAGLVTVEATAFTGQTTSHAETSGTH